MPAKLVKKAVGGFEPVDVGTCSPTEVCPTLGGWHSSHRSLVEPVQLGGASCSRIGQAGR